jgi:solute carrier family 8 (sodium/calcium exchanger)
MYLFLGISIVADIFMSAIEQITSVTVTRMIPGEDGEDEPVEIYVWNATVANLTLMALGSSAPEILLSVIETVQLLDSTPGELGPSTIVGSAAFNMLVITACSIAPVGPEGKRLEVLPVFLLTSFWATLSYIWLFLVLTVISPDEVELWEAIVTCVMMLLLVLTAFGADRCFKSKTEKDPTHNMNE